MDDIFIPPQNLDAEMAVLGALLIDGEALARIELSPEDFYRGGHQKIYTAMKNINKSGRAIDIITLSDELRRLGQLDDIGLSYLSRLASEVIISGNITEHAEIVKDSAIKRNIVNACREAIAGTQTDTVEEIVTKLRAKTADALSNRGCQIMEMIDIAKNTSKLIERRYQKKHELSGIPSGLPVLDDFLDGFGNGKVYIIAGRPGTGKTALSFFIALNAGVPVGRLDLEMSEGQLGLRALSSISQVELSKLRKGYISKDEWTYINKALGRMAELPIYYSFLAYNLEEVEKTVLQMVEKKGIKMLIVDYLQLIGVKKAHRNREQEVAEASRTMKRIAKTYNIPVLCLAQLNRAAELREGKKPTLADLRESGAIEQDADVVMFLWRQDPKSNNLKIVVAKGRDEGYGEIDLVFEGDKMLFYGGF